MSIYTHENVTRNATGYGISQSELRYCRSSSIDQVLVREAGQVGKVHPEGKRGEEGRVDSLDFTHYLSLSNQ